MEQQSAKSIFKSNNNSKVIGDWNAEFHDAFEEFPFVDASNSFHSDQSLSDSEHGSNEEDDVATVSVISDHAPDSPSSPSSAGLRHRRLVSQRSCKEFAQSQFFKNNPDGLIDFDPRDTAVSPGKKYLLSSRLNGNEKLNGKLNSTPVHHSSRSNGSQLTDETDVSSSITSVYGDERINHEFTRVNSPDSFANLLVTLAELLINALGFQTKLSASSFTFPILLMSSSYMLITNPFGILKYGKNYMLGNASGFQEICHSGIKWILQLLNRNHEPAWKLCYRIGWGLLWLFFFGFMLICLLIPAFLVSGMIMKWIVEEPIIITHQLTFDYTKDTPTAFVPIISCPQSSFLEHMEKRSKFGGIFESRVIPFDQELQTTVTLTLPESDYNRNLGIFQVRVDFLSRDDKPLASIRKPCMLQFKSPPVRYLSTFFKLASLLTGYSSETQTLDIKFDGYIEKYVPTSCLRVVIEQRAEFAKGAGVPEIYEASLKLETRLPFLKKMLWSWKGVIYLWISVSMFLVELLFTILFCAPLVFPQLRPRGVTVNNNASRNTHSGRS